MSDTPKTPKGIKIGETIFFSYEEYEGAYLKKWYELHATLNPDMLWIRKDWELRTLAEFMGWRYSPAIGCRPTDQAALYINEDHGCTFLQDFSYPTSYDALMPVWMKFRDLRETERFTNAQYEEYLKRRGRIAEVFSLWTIEQVFTLLVSAVTWYNKQVIDSKSLKGEQK